MDQSNSKNILRAWKNSECSQEQSNPINDPVIFPVNAIFPIREFKKSPASQ